MPDPRTEEAIELMMRFAERTGLASGQPRNRYLWTDAFAVCNFLGLARATGSKRCNELALQLVDQVHHALGRHRSDDLRSGWISGLGATQGEQHPTGGGLRIGKPLPERGPDEAPDEQLEWERDGQYFHYLSKWMHALDQVSRSTGRPAHNAWARELAAAAYAAFVYEPSGHSGARMYWKMSIDLSRPLVLSMGQHDPLDGYLTCSQLQATASTMSAPAAGPDVGHEARRFAELMARDGLATADPLGVGGLLSDAHRAQQLIMQGRLSDDGLLETLLTAALAGLGQYRQQQDFRASPALRLAFRELGLAIGLHAASLMREATETHPRLFPPGSPMRSCLRALLPFEPLRDEIEACWRHPAQHQTRLWSEHLDINEVMLATSLAPDGFLILRVPP